jgi:benzylsuccinate CoA-transferase BbsF subunit
MEKWGMSYPDISQINPRAILARICFIGHQGPLRDLKGFGNNASALSGITSLTAWEEGAPVGPYLAYGDHLAAYYTVAGILAALDHRDRTGAGRQVQISILGGIVSLLSPVVLEYGAVGTVRKPMGNRDDSAAPHGVYPCRGQEAWCAIAVTTNEEWQALARTIGEPWAKDPRLATVENRRRNQEELDTLLGRWTATWDKKRLMERLQKAGVPAGSVQTPRDILDDPQLKHRRHFIRLQHPDLGWHTTHTSTFRLSDAEGLPGMRAPLLGEHTYSICKDVLGIPDDLIARYYEEFLQ